MSSRISVPVVTGSSWSSGENSPCVSIISSSASGEGYPTEMRAVKRSS